MHSGFEVKSTKRVAKNRQLEYWNSLISDTFTSLCAEPAATKNFKGKLQRATLGNLCVAEVISNPAIVSHTANMVSSETEPFYLLHLQLTGTSINRQDDRKALLNFGDFTLCDSTRPYDLAFTDVNDMLVMRIPQQKLSSLLLSPEDLTCVHMSGQKGMSGLTSSMLRQVWSMYESRWDHKQQKRVADMLLNALASSYIDLGNQRISQDAVRQTRRTQVRYFVDSNLCDARMTPMFIASAFGISIRYLHLLFQNEDERVGQYIARRRLEVANSRLTDKSLNSKTISEIAYDLGFNSITHFGRVYKKMYGITASQARANTH